MSNSRATLPDSLFGRRLTESAAFALIAWALLGSRGLPLATFALLVLTGPILLLSRSLGQHAWQVQESQP